MEDVEKDLWEMKVKRQRQKAVDREEQVSIIREATAPRGPAIQPKNRLVIKRCPDHQCQISHLLLYIVINVWEFCVLK
jgi:hypothetical protein